MAVDSVAGIPAEEHCILRTAAAEVDPLSEVAACKALRPAEEHHIHHTDCYRFVAAEMVVVSVVVFVGRGSYCVTFCFCFLPRFS